MTRPRTMPGFNIRSPIAAVLIIAALTSGLIAVPNPAPAKAVIIPTSCIAALGLGAAGAATASVAASLIFVPVIDSLNLQANTVTASQTTALKTKSCLDEIMTGVLKIAINMARDMVIRWILTGRFESPVFSQSFTMDLKKSVENASRVFLSEISGIPFCQGINIPPRAFFGLSRDFTLQCTYNPTRPYFTGEPDDFSRYIASQQGANEYWHALILTMDQKLKTEARAAESFKQEYQAGQGFLCIKDERGRCTTPGSYVAALVMQSQVVSPLRQVDVANTVQQAIAAIIDTAIRASIERGLSKLNGG